MKKGLMLVSVLAVVAILLAGCALTGAPSIVPDQTNTDSAPRSSPVTQPPSPGLSTGTLTVFVTDAPEYTVTSVVVHFSEVWVHRAAGEEGGEGEWIELTITGGSFGPGSVDLAELNGDEAKVELAAEELVAGKYTQIRVIMDEEEGVQVDYKDPDGNLHQDVTAKLPSGELKFVRPFEVVAGENTEILLDFDLQKSVVFTGPKKGGAADVIVKPVVKLSVSEKGKPVKLEATLGSDTEAVAEWSTAYYKTAPNSVHLQTTGTVGTGKEARIAVSLPANTTLGQITGISWWTRLVTGYIPHVDIVLDMDGNGVRDHILTAEGAYQNGDLTTGWPTGIWFQTFTGASGTYPSWSGLTGNPNVGKVDDTTAVWLSPAPSPPGPPDQASIAKLSSYKAGLYGVSSSTKVLALEIEVDNWVVQSEAYVDMAMVTIGSTSYIFIP